MITEILDNLEQALESRDRTYDKATGPTYWADEFEATARQLRELVGKERDERAGEE